VTSFVMIGEKDKMTRSKIYNPDHIIVLDHYLPKFINVVEGIKKNGTLTINITKSQQDVLKKIINEVRIKLGIVDATLIAQKVLGRPITNTAMLGAFVKVSEVVSFKSILKAIESRFRGEMLEKNLKAAMLGYKKVKIKTFL